MADYFTTFSFAILDLTNEESAWLAHQADPGNHGRAWTIDPDGEGKDWPDFTMTINEEPALARKDRLQHGERPYGTYAVFGCEDDGDEAQVASLLHAFVRAFPARAPIGFSFSYTYSKAEFNAFGGGAAYVTAEGVEFMRSAAWLARKLAGTAPPDLNVNTWRVIAAALRFAGADAEDYKTSDALAELAARIGDYVEKSDENSPPGD